MGTYSPRGRSRHLLETPPFSDPSEGIVRYGVFVSQHGQLGAIPRPPFLSVPPLKEHAKKGVSQRYLRDTL